MSLIPILGDVADLVEHFIPDATQEQQDKFAQLLNTNQETTQLLAAQAAIDAAEAASGSLWNSGWRPLLGWGLSLAMIFIAIVPPMTEWVCGLVGHPVPPMPHFDPIVMEALFAILGVNITARSYEKLKGVQGKH